MSVLYWLWGISGSALMHDFYSKEVANPVQLIIDTGFRNEEASIKADVSVNLSLRDWKLATQFNEIPLDLMMTEAERPRFPTEGSSDGNAAALTGATTATYHIGPPLEISEDLISFIIAR
ncbi:hypothetical protein ACLOJK_040891 [Asimina triloba]